MESVAGIRGMSRPTGTTPGSLQGVLWEQPYFSQIFDLFCLSPLLSCMAVKHKLLSQQLFNQVNSSSGWRIQELEPWQLADIPGIQRKEDILGAFVSGDSIATRFLNQRHAVLGIDVICYERNPQTAKGEGPINVYHYVATKTHDERFPYCLHGKFTEETLMGHWPPDLDLSVYGLS